MLVELVGVGVTVDSRSALVPGQLRLVHAIRACFLHFVHQLRLLDQFLHPSREAIHVSGALLSLGGLREACLGPHACWLLLLVADTCVRVLSAVEEK